MLCCLIIFSFLFGLFVCFILFDFIWFTILGPLGSYSLAGLRLDNININITINININIDIILIFILIFSISYLVFNI